MRPVTARIRVLGTPAELQALSDHLSAAFGESLRVTAPAAASFKGGQRMYCEIDVPATMTHESDNRR
jgi:hypothetical protein